MHLKQILWLGALGILGAGCAALTYVGDGKLSDSGPLASHDRYIVNLGSIGLAKPQVKVFELSRFPDTELTVALNVSTSKKPDQHLYETKPLGSVVVGFEMRNERDEVVISTMGALSSWSWGGAIDEPQWSFVYRGGAFHEIPVRPGVGTDVRDGELADDGWGTYFTPRSNGRYKLKVSVVESSSADRQYQVQVQARGGGWK